MKTKKPINNSPFNVSIETTIFYLSNRSAKTPAKGVINIDGKKETNNVMANFIPDPVVFKT